MTKTVRFVTVAAVTAAIGVTSIVSASGAPRAAAAPPTGDVEAITLWQKIQAAYGSTAAVQITRTGYVAAKRRGTKVQFIFGRRGPAGFSRAQERLVFNLSAGNVTQVTDELKAPRVGAFAVAANGAGVFIRYHGCWTRTSLSSLPATRPGQAFVDLNENVFLPLVPQANGVLSRFSFPWGSRRGSESDTIDTDTNTIVSGEFHVPGLFSETHRLVSLPSQRPNASFSPRCR